MTTNNHATIVNFIWTVADDILRDIYVKGKYRDVILPMTVLTRIDSELAPTKEEVLAKLKQYENRVTNVGPILMRTTGYPFYNTSNYTLASLLEDPDNITANFRQYLNGYSENIQDILKKFKFYNQIDTLDENGIVFALIQKFAEKSTELSPARISNHDMGYIFEELIRKFNEENNEEAGEHFTPPRNHPSDGAPDLRAGGGQDSERAAHHLRSVCRVGRYALGGGGVYQVRRSGS